MSNNRTDNKPERKNECLVSVIIPIYNVGNYLENCLGSLRDQTLKEIEIICVNDGSTDQSQQIIDSFVQSDMRFRGFYHENRGVSYTRNRGLKEACGKYIYFMDGDDMLETEALWELYQQAETKDLDLLCFNGRTLVEENVEELISEQKRSYYIRKSDYPEVCSGSEMFEKMITGNEFRASVALQFVKREHLVRNNIWFHEGIIHEDNPYSVLVMILARRAGYVDNLYFIRRYRSNSIMTTPERFVNVYGYFMTYCDLWSQREDYLRFTEEQRLAVGLFLKQTLTRARDIYARLSKEEQMKSEKLELTERIPFGILVEDPGMVKYQLNEKQKLLQKTYDEKAQRGVEIKELKQKLQKTYDEKAQRGVEIKELKQKLQKTYDEKAQRGLEIKELKQKLQAVCDEKTRCGEEIKKLKSEMQYYPLYRLKRWLKRRRKN